MDFVKPRMQLGCYLQTMDPDDEIIVAEKDPIHENYVFKFQGTVQNALTGHPRIHPAPMDFCDQVVDKIQTHENHVHFLIDSPDSSKCDGPRNGFESIPEALPVPFPPEMLVNVKLSDLLMLIHEKTPIVVTTETLSKSYWETIGSGTTKEALESMKKDRCRYFNDAVQCIEVVGGQMVISMKDRCIT